MKAGHEEMKISQDELMAILESWQEEMYTCREVTEACREKMEVKGQPGSSESRN
jgi:hypothetical protein